MKEENAPALPRLSGVLTLSLSNLAPGGGREREREREQANSPDQPHRWSVFLVQFKLCPSFLPSWLPGLPKNPNHPGYQDT